MKKIILSIVAVAALAACTKSEVEYETPAEIGFAPVAHNITKSVAGVGTDATFPTDLDLYIYANAQTQNADGTLKDEWITPYFKNVQFEHKENNIFDGTPAQYWPNVKSLIFAGYSQACNSTSLNPTMDFAKNELTINGYVQDNSKTATGANDLMWFPTTSAYTKQANAIGVELQHACSWITVKVQGDATTANNYLLKDITINNLYHKGNAACGATSATWSSYGNQSNENLYHKDAGETFPGDKAKVFENVANNMVVLPQTPTSIDVTYSYVSQSGLDPITETVKGINLKVSDTAADNKWESGKHYVYTLTITATEILVQPTVDGWDAPTTPGLKI